MRIDCFYHFDPKVVDENILHNDSGSKATEGHPIKSAQTTGCQEHLTKIIQH